MPEGWRRLKAAAPRDITVDGPELAGQALSRGLVDEVQMIVCPVVVGGGERFFPDGEESPMPEDAMLGLDQRRCAAARDHEGQQVPTGLTEADRAVGDGGRY